MPSNNPASTTVTQHASNSSAPYVGPRPFTQKDRDIFFGRTQEAIELTSLVKAHPEVVLYAQSGAGKSSLLFAQVMPILDTEEEFDVLPVGRVRSQESSVIPDQKINNIYMFNALKDLSGDQLSVMERAQLTLADFLKRRPRPPVPSKEAADGHNTDSPDNQEKRLARVITFDQFEEIFTLYPERYKDRQDFFFQVAEALKADPFLRVIFSMREDYIAEVEPYIHVLPQNLRTRFRLERLRKTNALTAVQQPLQNERVNKVGRYFVDGAAESLVDRLMLIKVKTASGEKIEEPGEFVDPVQLQVVCQTLWEKLPPEKVEITKADIDEYANVDEALSDFYESCVRKAVAAVNKAEEQSTITEGQLRGWFEQKLITREGKRNMVFRERDTVAGLKNEVVDELENSHVIRVEMRGGEPWYELSHDRFIPPIRESNRRFLLKQPLAKRKAQELEARADEWRASQRSNALLLNRGELVDAQNWMATDAAAIGYSDNLFALVQASEAAIEHEDKQQQQLLAEAQQRQMLAEKQRSRQMKLGFLVTSVLLIFAIASAVVAWTNQREAQRAQRKAVDAQREAETARLDVTAALGKSEKAAEDLRLANVNEAKARERADDEKEAAEKAQAQTAVALADTKAAQAKTNAALKEAEDAKSDLTTANARLAQKKDEAWSIKLAAADVPEVLSKDPEKALRIALTAVDLSDTWEARIALRRTYLKSSQQTTLRGHKGSIGKAAFSPDGLIVTMSEDGSLRIWDPKAKIPPKILDIGAPVHAFAISSDGNWLAAEHADAKGSILNLRDGTYKELHDLTGPVAALAVSPDGKLLATEATEDEGQPGAAPRIWEMSTGKILATLKGHRQAVCSIAFSPAGDRVATASWDATARIWDVKTGRQLAILEGHTAPLTSIAFDRTGQLVVTGSFDRTARVWDLATGKEKFALRGHAGVVHSAVFSPDNTHILTAGKELNGSLKMVTEPVPLPEALKEIIKAKGNVADNTARMWNAQSGNLLLTLKHTDDVSSAVFSSNGEFILTASDDSTASIWNASTGNLITRLGGDGRSINTAVFSPDGESVLSASDDSTAQIWNWKKIRRFRFLAHDREVISSDFAGDGSIITAEINGTVKVWDLNGTPKSGGSEIRTGSLLDAQAKPNDRFTDITINQEQGLVVTSSSRGMFPDHKAHVWNLKKKKFEPDLGGHDEPVSRVLFSPTGKYLATMSDNRVIVRNTSTFDVIKDLPASSKKDTSKMVTLAFSENEESFVVAQADGNEKDGTLLITDLVKGNTRSIPLQTNIWTAAFNPKADLIAVSSEKGVGVWTVEGVKLFNLRLYGVTTKLVFSADNNWLLTAGLDNQIRVWSTTGEKIYEFSRLPPGASISTLAYNSDRSVIAGDSRGNVHVLACEVCQPFKDILGMAREMNPRQLTEEEDQELMGKEKDSLRKEASVKNGGGSWEHR